MRNKDYYADVLEGIREYLKEYAIVHREYVEVRKDLEGKFLIDKETRKDTWYFMFGLLPHDAITKALNEFNYEELDKEGVWSITCLIFWFRGDMEEPSYAEVCYCEYVFHGTFEDIEKQESYLAGNDFLNGIIPS